MFHSLTISYFNTCVGDHTTEWRRKSGEFHFVAYNVYASATDILKISITYLQYVKH